MQNPKTITLLLYLKAAIEKITQMVELLRASSYASPCIIMGYFECLSTRLNPLAEGTSTPGHHAESKLLLQLCMLMTAPATFEGAYEETPAGMHDALAFRSTSVDQSVDQGQSVDSQTSVDNQIVNETGLDMIRTAIDMKIAEDAVAARGAEALRAHQTFVIKPGEIGRARHALHDRRLATSWASGDDGQRRSATERWIHTELVACCGIRSVGPSEGRVHSIGNEGGGTESERVEAGRLLSRPTACRPLPDRAAEIGGLFRGGT